VSRPALWLTQPPIQRLSGAFSLGLNWPKREVDAYYYIYIPSTQLSRYREGLRTGRPGFDSRKRQVIFLNSSVSRPALGPTQPSIQRASGALSAGVKRQVRKVDHSPQSSEEVKNGEAITPFLSLG
jgi:hypothetical protein